MIWCIGDMHMLALTHDCAVYSWGLNSDGQCATGDLDSLLVTNKPTATAVVLTRQASLTP